MQRPLSGARASSCLCAAFRAFHFTRRCPSGYPCYFSLNAAPAWVGVGARDPAAAGDSAGSGAITEGRKIWRKRQVSGSGNQRRDSSPTARRPRAASCPHGSSRKIRGSGGKRPDAAAAPRASRTRPPAAFWSLFAAEKVTRPRKGETLPLGLPGLAKNQVAPGRETPRPSGMGCRQKRPAPGGSAALTFR